MPEDIVPLLNDITRRITSLESKPLGTVYVNEVIVARDPETGVETVMGDLTEYGEDRVGIKQWVNDTEPPPIMTSPMAIANLGTISVTWDGATASGEPNSADFSHLNVYSYDGVSTKHIGVIRSANDFAMFLDPVYNQEYIFSFTSVDFNGNESEPSEPSLPVSAKPLVDALEIQNILDEINIRFDGVIDEALQLNNRLEEANQTITETKSSLDNLENVKLPQVEANIETAHQEIVSTGNELRGKLSQAETELQDHKTRLEKSESDLNNLSSVTLPGLKTDLDQAKTDLTKLDTDLGATKTTLDTTKQDVDTLKNTTLPGLKTDISSAQTRLDTAEAGITDSKGRLDKAEEDLSSAFGQLGTVDSRINTAKTQAAADAQAKADAAQAEAKRLIDQVIAKGQNLVRNGDFESGGEGWNIGSAHYSIVSAPVRSGIKSLQVKDFGSTNAWPTSEWVPSSTGRTFYVEFWVREGGTPDDNGQIGAVAQVKTSSGGTSSLVFAKVSSASVPNFAWTKISGYATPTTEDVVAIRFAPWFEGPTASSYNVDDFLAVDVTEAQAALQRADQAILDAASAHTAAGSAQTTANNALTMAGSKSKVYYSTANPSGTASVGDTWRKVDSSNNVIAEWRWTDKNVWTPQQITSEVISNLDVGKLTAGSAIIQTAVINKIAAQSASIIELDASRITTGKLGAARIDVTDLAAAVATVIKLNASSIIAGTIDTGRLNASEIAAAVANIIQLNADRITAGIINTDRLNTNEIAARVATVIQLNADRITAGTINTDRLNAVEIAAKTAAFQKVDIKNLFVTTGTFSEAVIDKLWADVIRARKIAADQILIGQGENLIPYHISGTNKDVSNIISYGKPGGNTPIGIQGSGGVANGDHLYQDASWVVPGSNTLSWVITQGPGSNSYTDSYFSVEPAEELSFSAYFKAGGTYTNGSPKVALCAYFYTKDRTVVSNVSSPLETITWSWVKRELSLKVPDTAVYMALYVRQDQPGGVRLDLPSLYRKKGASLIVDGAIEAKHITASESLSAKIGQFLKLDVKDLVSTGTATLNEAVINKLWTDVVHSKKITTEMLAIGDFTNQIATGLGMNNESIDWAEGLTPDFVDVPVGISHSFKSAVGQGTLATKSNFFDVNPGDEFVLEVWIKADKPGSRIFFELRDQNGAHGVTSTRLVSGDSFYGNASYPINNAPVPTTWTRWRAKCIPKEGVRSLRIASIYFNHPNGTERNAQIWLAGVSFRKRFGGELIVDGAVTAEKIAANAVEADKLAANSVTADKIEAGAVKAQHVGAKEISAEKLRIGEGTNIFTDTLMKDTEGWGIHPSLSPAPDGYGPSNRVRVTAGSGQTGGYYGYKDTMTDRRSKVIPGRTYKISVWVRPTVNISANNVIAVYTRLYSESGGYTTGYEWTTPSNFTNSMETTGLSTIPAGQWVKMESQFLVPSDKEKVFLTPGFYLNAGFPTGSSCDFSNLVISEMTSGELIVDGSITTEKISTKSITTDQLSIGVGSNIFPDPKIKDKEEWEYSGVGSIVEGGGVSGNSFRITSNGTSMKSVLYGNERSYSKRIPVTPGRTYKISYRVKSNIAAGTANGIRVLLTLYPDNVNSTDWTNLINLTIPNDLSSDDKWTSFSYDIKVPENSSKTYVTYGLIVDPVIPKGHMIEWCDLALTEMTSGDLIVNGSITSEKISSDAISGKVITGGVISGATIKGASITGGNITTDLTSGSGIRINSTIGLVSYQTEDLLCTVNQGQFMAMGNNQTIKIGIPTSSSTGLIRWDSQNSTKSGILSPDALMTNPLFGISLYDNLLLQSPATGTKKQAGIGVGSTSSGGTVIISATDIILQPELSYNAGTSDIGLRSLSTGALSVDADILKLRITRTVSGARRTSDLQLSGDGTSGFVQSVSTYNRTYSSAPQMCITGNGVFGRLTSALKYKQDVKVENVETYEDSLLSIEHKSWVDKAEMRRYNEYLEWQESHPYHPLTQDMAEYPTKPPKRHFGSIADEFHDKGLTQFVEYNSNGEVEGLLYDRLGSALIPIVKKQRDAINDLESTVQFLINKIEEIEKLS